MHQPLQKHVTTHCVIPGRFWKGKTLGKGVEGTPGSSSADVSNGDNTQKATNLDWAPMEYVLILEGGSFLVFS